MASRREGKLRQDPAWIGDLQDLQREMAGLDVDFPDSGIAHSVVLYLDRDLYRDRSEPRFSSVGGPLIERFSCDLSSGGRITHYIFADRGDPDVTELKYRALLKKLRSVSTMISSIPNKVLPSLPALTFGNANHDRLARWCCTLHQLVGLKMQDSFGCHEEFAHEQHQAGLQIELFPWEEFPSPEQFDIRKSILSDCNDAKALTKWRELFENEGCEFPGAISLTLTKPIVLASKTAPNNIILKYRELAWDTDIVSNESREKGVKEDDVRVLSVLRSHHRCGEDAPNFEPMKQEELATAINRSQKVVSESVNFWMGQVKSHASRKGASKYKTLCKEEIIHEVLDFLDAPKSMRERAYANMENFEG